MTKNILRVGNKYTCTLEDGTSETVTLEDAPQFLAKTKWVDPQSSGAAYPDGELLCFVKSIRTERTYNCRPDQLSAAE